MRILHTSDWHLGIRTGATSRGPDHDRFLDWLVAELASRSVDTLVVAGDVFDSMQPSAEALGRYYRFLGRVGARSGVRQVVIVGGNHDGASRLDAPAEVLSALNVHVVGGIGGDPATWDRCLVPLRDRQDRVCAVALAVPYVHEFRLGVRTTDLDHAAVRAAFTERFGELYTTLAERARKRWPHLPLVATGHLTLGPARSEDYPHEIHQVGRIEGLPPSVLDDRVQYAALGHIHRPYPVDPGRRAWYSGSPVALSLPESRSPRRVLCVDLDPDPEGAPQVQPVTVPVTRGLIELQAPPDRLLDRVRELTWHHPLPPLLFCRVLTDEHDPRLVGELHQALREFPEADRPAVVELREVRQTPLPEEDTSPPASLDDLTPHQVFTRLCRARGISDPEPLEAAFGSIASLSEGDFEAFLQRTRGGQE